MIILGVVKSRPIWKLNKLTNFQGIVMIIRLVNIMKVVLTRLNEGSVLEINVCLLKIYNYSSTKYCCPKGNWEAYLYKIKKYKKIMNIIKINYIINIIKINNITNISKMIN